MRIIKESNHNEPHIVLEANICGDHLPQTVTIHHNGREIEYKRITL